MVSFHDWLTFITDLGRPVCIPLIVAGVGLMVFGWRMSRVCVVLAYGVFGAGVTASLVGRSGVSWWICLAGGAGLGLISYWPWRHAVAGLGGLIGGGITMFAVQGIGFSDAALWGAGILAFLAFGAFSYIHQQHVVIGVTALFGSAFVISGLAVCLKVLPALDGTVRSLAAESFFVIPFVLFVSTVVSCFYQVGEMHRLMAD